MEKKVKRSFVFNIDWRDVLMDYPADVRYEVYDAIIEYAASGKLLELKPLAKMAFSFIKKEMDFNYERYKETVAKRSEAGKKGMSVRYAAKGDPTYVTSDNKTNKSYQMVTKLTSDNKTNIYDNDNEECNNDIKENTPDGVQKKSPPTPYENFLAWMRENTPNVLKLKSQVSESQYAKLREKYNHKQLVDILLAMENYKELTKKYTSVYLTFLKWAKKEYGTD